jgi:hypothetical protein
MTDTNTNNVAEAVWHFKDAYLGLAGSSLSPDGYATQSHRRPQEGQKLNGVPQ